MAQLRALLGLSERDESSAWKIQRAIQTGELVTVPDRAPKTTTIHHSGGGPAAVAPASRARGFALTPSQAFGRVTSALAGADLVQRPTLPRLPTEDFFAIMSANPGDVLPDGSIAKALDAAPFEYVPHTLSEEAMELAASTNNPKFAAKMLGYSRSEFRDMVHRFKKTLGVGPDETLEWHDNGDVYFKGIYLDNFNDYQD